MAHPRVDELVSRFGPRIAPSASERAREVAGAIVDEHPAEDLALLAARFVVRADGLLAPFSVLYPEAPGTLAEPALTPVERRLRLADRLSANAPPELFDGTPIRWAPAALGRDDVLSWWKAWAESRRSEQLFVYVHVPFCRTRCSFCQFHSVISPGAEERAAYVRALVDEASAFEAALGTLDADAVTIGGGTPSELDEPALRRVLDALVGRVFRLREGAYFSVELNPDSCTAGKVDAFVGAGVTRISFGVQSFHEPTLRAVARGYQTADMVEAAVGQVRAASSDVQLGLDLLAPLPEETLSTFDAGARRAFELAPDQIVLFEYQPVSRGARTIEAGALPFVDAAARFLAIARDAGYEQVPNTGSSAIVQRPGAREFPVRYVQHPREPASMLGLGPFAESHVLGQGRYVGLAEPEEGRAYRGERTTMHAEKGRMIARALGADLAIDERRYGEIFGEPPSVSFGPELAYLDERRELADLQPRFENRDAARRAAWLFLDEDDLRRLRRPLDDTSLRGLLDWLRSAGASIEDGDALRRLGTPPWEHGGFLEPRAFALHAVHRAGTISGRIDAEPHLTEDWVGAFVDGPLAALWERLVADGRLSRPGVRIGAAAELTGRVQLPARSALAPLLTAAGQSTATIPNEQAWETVSEVRVSGRALRFVWMLASESRLRETVEAALDEQLGELLAACSASYVRSSDAAHLEYAIGDREALDAHMRAQPNGATYVRLTDELRAVPRHVMIPVRGARPLVDELVVELERVPRRRLKVRA